MPTEQGPQQQVGERPSEGIGRNVCVAEKIQMNQTGEFPKNQHQDRCNKKKRKNKKRQMPPQIQQPQQYPGIKQGLDEPETLPGLKGPDTEYNEVEDHTLCQNATRPVHPLQGKDKSIQSQIQNSQCSEEESGGTNRPTELLMPFFFIFCQDKEAAQNIKGKWRGAAEIPHCAADRPRKTEGQHTDRGHQQKF